MITIHFKSGKSIDVHNDEVAACIERNVNKGFKWSTFQAQEGGPFDLIIQTSEIEYIVRSPIHNSL